ncbi:thioredoxin family protein [Neptuniibacter sp. QD29_5]|uniref:thioredoxin family protein n=1 Tax=unclassified Neptuniibacter TaxID=2630693 RepID=UPI0039F67A98
MPESRLTFSENGHEYSQPLALIWFSAKWCGPCQQMIPVVNSLAERYAGELKVLKVDVDQQQELAAKFAIRAVPTLVLLAKDKALDQQVGSVPLKQLDEWVAQHLSIQKELEK